MILETLPLADDTVEDFEWGDISGGNLLVNYEESERYDADAGETHILAVNDVEIIGLHVGGLVVLSPDEMIAMHSKTAFRQLEERLLEQRREVV